MARTGAWMRRATRQVLCCQFRGRAPQAGCLPNWAVPHAAARLNPESRSALPALLLLLLFVQFQRDMIAAEQPDLVVFR